MEKSNLPPEPMHPGKLTDENIRRIFAGADDLGDDRHGDACAQRTEEVGDSH